MKAVLTALLATTAIALVPTAALADDAPYAPAFVRYDRDDARREEWARAERAREEWARRERAREEWARAERAREEWARQERARAEWARWQHERWEREHRHDWRR